MKNLYLRRQVASHDARPCLICQTPTCVVLYNDSGPDWFPCCEIHLKGNPTFAEPVYSSEYHALLAELESLGSKTAHRQQGGGWDTWVAMLARGKPKVPTTESETNDEDETEKKPMQDVNDARAALMDKIAALQQTKQYNLSDIMFNSRTARLRQLQERREAQRKQERLYSNTDPDELITKFQFPEVPK